MYKNAIETMRAIVALNDAYVASEDYVRVLALANGVEGILDIEEIAKSAWATPNWSSDDNLSSKDYSNLEDGFRRESMQVYNDLLSI